MASVQRKSSARISCSGRNGFPICIGTQVRDGECYIFGMLAALRKTACSFLCLLVGCHGYATAAVTCHSARAELQVVRSDSQAEKDDCSDMRSGMSESGGGSCCKSNSLCCPYLLVPYAPPPLMGKLRRAFQFSRVVAFRRFRLFQFHPFRPRSAATPLTHRTAPSLHFALVSPFPCDTRPQAT